MNKRINIFLLLLALLVTIVWGIFYLGFSYEYPGYVKKVIEDTNSLSNFESQISISIAFEKKSNEELLNKVNNSVFVLNETKNGTDQYIKYSFDTQGESFNGKRLLKDNQIIIKSPMYHRYISFSDAHLVQKQGNQIGKITPILTSFIEKNNTIIQRYRDIGANENRVTTLKIYGANKDMKQSLLELLRISDTPYAFLYYENLLIKNKLLKEELTEEEIDNVTKKNIEHYKNEIKNLLSNSEMKESDVVVKFSKDNFLKEVNIDTKMIYTNPTTKEETHFSLYFTFDLWNVGQTEVQDILTDITNSISYEKMTNDMQYFEDENKKEEINEQEDRNHAQKGYEENISTLKDFEMNMLPLLPEK